MIVVSNLRSKSENVEHIRGRGRDALVQRRGSSSYLALFAAGVSQGIHAKKRCAWLLKCMKLRWALKLPFNMCPEATGHEKPGGVVPCLLNFLKPLL